MNVTLKPLLRICVLVFFDDILIYSKTLEEHVEHIRQVFHLLAKDKWLLKRSKCQFARQSIAYLGHVISAEGVATDPSKIQSIHSWPTPTDAKQLRSFLGLAGYYRKFVRHFAILARPLTDLLKKGTMFLWTSVHDGAFTSLKNALVTAPVLALPDFSRPFQIQTDASDMGVGVVLLQDGHPLAFISKALGPRTRSLSTYEKEYLAIMVAVDQWRSYLQHAEFVIFSDHRSLSHIADQRLHTPWQLKMYTKLAGLQYTVVYKPGTSNMAADALSRHPAPPAQLNAISYSTPEWLSEVVAGYDSDPASSKLLQELAVAPSSHPPFTLVSGVLRYRGRVWIGCNHKLQHRSSRPSMIPSWVDIPAFRSLMPESASCSLGRVSSQMSGSLSGFAPPVFRLNQIAAGTLDSFLPFLCRLNPGRSYLLISLKVFPSRVLQTACW